MNSIGRGFRLRRRRQERELNKGIGRGGSEGSSDPPFFGRSIIYFYKK